MSRVVAVVGIRESPTRKIKSTRSISRVVAVVGAEGSPHPRNRVDMPDFVGSGSGGQKGVPHPQNRADTLDFAGAGDGGGEKGVTNPEIRYERARFREVVVAEGICVVYNTLAV